MPANEDTPRNKKKKISGTVIKNACMEVLDTVLKSGVSIEGGNEKRRFRITIGSNNTDERLKSNTSLDS